MDFLNKIANLLLTTRQKRALKYSKGKLYRKFVKHSLFVSFAISAAVMLALLKYLGYLAILIALCSFFAVFYCLVERIVAEVEEEEFVISMYTPIVYNMFLNTLRATGSVFDAIKAIKDANFPYISEKFEEVYWRTQSGESPKYLLRKITRKQPSLLFRKSFSVVIDMLTRKSNEYYKLGEIHEAFIVSRIEADLRELEGRALIYIGIAYLAPLLAIIASAFLFSIQGYKFLLLYLPLHLLVLVLLGVKLIKKQLRWVGGH